MGEQSQKKNSMCKHHSAFFDLEKVGKKSIRSLSKIQINNRPPIRADWKSTGG
jgi:hypothetical protein